MRSNVKGMMKQAVRLCGSMAWYCSSAASGSFRCTAISASALRATIANAGARCGSESSASADAAAEVRRFVAPCDPLRESDRADHERVLCDGSRRSAYGGVLQPSDVGRAQVEVAELVLEQGPHRERARTARLGHGADVAHVAGRFPVALVNGQPGVVESRGGERPAVAKSLREREFGCGVGVNLFPLSPELISAQMIDRRALISVWSSPAWLASSIAFVPFSRHSCGWKCHTSTQAAFASVLRSSATSPCVRAIDSARSKARCASPWFGLDDSGVPAVLGEQLSRFTGIRGDELQRAGDELGEGGVSQSQREGDRAGRDADRPTDVANLFVVVEGTTQTA